MRATLSNYHSLDSCAAAWTWLSRTLIHAQMMLVVAGIAQSIAVFAEGRTAVLDAGS